MANIEITRVCNLSCPYCFAANHINDSFAGGPSSFITQDEFESRLDFLDRSGMDQVRLIGGEPTLHPEFGQLILRARKRNKKILVFSNGLLSRSALETLLDIPPDACTVLINMNSTNEDRKEIPVEKRRIKVIEELQGRALLGYNIYQRKFDLTYLLPIIQEFHCQKSIRIGIAHPILEATNKYLHPKNYRQVAIQLVEQAVDANRFQVRLELDCGFVRCMFSTEELETLIGLNTDLGWRCSPVLDIGITRKVFMCFPTSEWMNMDLAELTDAAQFRNSMTAKTEPYHTSGIYPECSDCIYKKRKECSGGGLENIIRRFQHTPFRINVPSTLSQD